MKTLLFVVVLLLIGFAVFGFYRGWFHLSTNSTDQQPSATVTVDKDKIQEDEQRAKEAVQGIGHKVKETADDVTAKVKQ